METKKLLLQYVKKCGGKATKSEVERYMMSKDVPERYRISRITTRKVVDEFEDYGSIIVKKGQRTGQSHKLEFNEKDHFNILTTEIDRLEKDFVDMNRLVLKNKVVKGVNGNFVHKHIRNLIHMEQLFFYGKISNIITRINRSIKNLDNRESLYLRLVSVLAASDKLNEALFPEILNAVRDMYNDLHAHKIVKGSLAAKLVSETSVIINSLSAIVGDSNQIKSNPT